MKKALLASAVAFSMLTMLSIMASAATGKSAIGTWKLDAAKSSFGSMSAPKFEQLVVATDSSSSLKWTMNGASSDGKTYTSSFDGPTDGKEHSFMSSQGGSKIAYTRIAGGGVKWTVKGKNGAVIETGSSHLSADGDTLTLKGTTQGPSGKSDFVSVFTKVQ
jgi:hypothetical protein